MDFRSGVTPATAFSDSFFSFFFFFLNKIKHKSSKLATYINPSDPSTNASCLRNKTTCINSEMAYLGSEIAYLSSQVAYFSSKTTLRLLTLAWVCLLQQ